MVVTKSFTPKLDVGDEVTSLDGIPTKTIFKRLVSAARADGTNDGKRRAYIEVQGDEKLAAFDLLYPLYFPVSGATIKADFTTFGGVRKRESIDLQTAKDRELQVNGTKKPGNEAQWTFQISGKSAILTTPTWALYNSDLDYLAYLQNAFDQLVNQKVEHLIIDLRDCEGGNSIGDIILEYLVTKVTKLDALKSYVRQRKVPFILKPFLDTWDSTFYDWGSFAKEPERIASANNELRRLIRWEDQGGGTVIKPANLHFSGQVTVLVDGTCSSATFEFAKQLRDLKLGRLVGEPTGGNQRGINGGAFFFLRLPNSGIEVDIPLVGQFPDRPSPDAGLSPDILIPVTKKDIRLQRDAAME